MSMPVSEKSLPVSGKRFPGQSATSGRSAMSGWSDTSRLSFEIIFCLFVKQVTSRLKTVFSKQSVSFKKFLSESLVLFWLSVIKHVGVCLLVRSLQWVSRHSARVVMLGTGARYKILKRGVLRSSSRRSSTFPALMGLNRIPRDSCQVRPAGPPLCHNTHWCLPRAPRQSFSDFLASEDRRSRTQSRSYWTKERRYASPSAFRSRLKSWDTYIWLVKFTIVVISKEARLSWADVVIFINFAGNFGQFSAVRYLCT